MKKFLGLFAGVMLLLCSSLLCSSMVQAELQTYRIMAGSTINMDLGGAFNNTAVDFTEGGLVQVDVTPQGVVQRIEVNEIVLAHFGLVLTLGSAGETPATVTFANEAGWLALTGTGEGELTPSKVNKVKTEGFYVQNNTGKTPGVTRQYVRSSLLMSGPTYWLPARPSATPSDQKYEVPYGGLMQNNKGGFMKMVTAGRVVPGFGGPLQLRGGAKAEGVQLNLGIFGRDQTHTSGIQHQQAMSWANGTAKARFGGDFNNRYFGPYFLGGPTEVDDGVGYPNYNTSLPGQLNLFPHAGEKYTTGTAMALNTNSNVTMPTHTGIGPYFYADGNAAGHAWAKPVAPGGASQTTMGATVKVKKLGIVSEYRSVRPGGAGPGLTTQHLTPSGAFTTIVGKTDSYAVNTIFPEVVTMSLVSPAIMNVGTGMALIGFINVNLQRVSVPEPGPMILMGVSALCLAGISLARGRKN